MLKKRNIFRWVFKILILFVYVGFLTACTTNIGHQASDKISKASAAASNIELGLTYLGKGDVKIAKQKFMLALNEAPQKSSSWYSMAYFLEMTGQLQKAEAYYLRAIKMNPRLGASQNNYGTFLCRHGRYQAAIQHFEIAANIPAYLEVAAAYKNAAHCAMLIPDHLLAHKYNKLALLNGAK